MQKKTLIIVGALVVTITGAMLTMGEYNRVPEGAAEKEEVAQVSATELHDAFLADEGAATAKYVGTTEQAIRVSGVVRAIEPSGEGLVNVTLETGDPIAGVVCEFATADVPADWRPGSSVALKGICTGFLIDVILNRCAAVE